MRLSQYLLIIATIGWMAVALVWAIHSYVVDISFAPIGLVYLAAFAVSALAGGIIFDEVGKWAAHAEFGGVSLPRPATMLQNLRGSMRARRANAASKREGVKKRSRLRRW